MEEERQKEKRNLKDKTFANSVSMAKNVYESQEKRRIQPKI
jgi:hypothetical protein